MPPPRPFLPALLLPFLAACAAPTRTMESAADFHARFERNLRNTPSLSFTVRTTVTATREGKEERRTREGAWTSAPGRGARYALGAERGTVDPAVPPSYPVAVAARTGFLLLAARPFAPDPASPAWLPGPVPPVTDLRFAPDDATETRHLLYTLHPDPATAVAVELWIDGATLHPMGRRAWLATGTTTLRLEESYASFRTEEIPAADLP